MIKKRFGSKQYKFRIHPNFLIQIVIIKKKKCKTYAKPRGISSIKGSIRRNPETSFNPGR